VDASAGDPLARFVRDVADFPTPGIVFKDLTPLLADPAGFAEAVDRMVAAQGAVDVVAGIEARGFILAAPMALRLGAGFVPVRKAGKLPRETVREACTLEYGEAVLEVHADAFSAGQRVLLVDDVLATGGTAAAAAALVRRLGAEPVGLAVLLELGFLNGVQRVAPLPVTAVMTV
jgi:adenine phosphoribosyltransferase